MGISDLEMPSGEMTQTDKDKADALNKFFTSVFTREDLENMLRIEKKHTGDSLMSVDISPEKVLKQLKKLKKHKSAGPDGFHPRVLSETAQAICEPLSLIFNKSLKQGKLPRAWKDGNIVPIFKKGSRKLAGNYRPISLTSVCGKIMESFIREAIVNHMMTNNLFCNEQHGFVPGRSCITQLLEMMEIWTEMLDSGNAVDVIYLDFKKAFDSVPHERLLSKVRAYGVDGEIEAWLQDFLKGRRQRVVINGSYSKWTDVLSGIPQPTLGQHCLYYLLMTSPSQ